MQVIFRGSIMNQFSLMHSAQSLNAVLPAPKVNADLLVDM